MKKITHLLILRLARQLAHQFRSETVPSPDRWRRRRRLSGNTEMPGTANGYFGVSRDTRRYVAENRLRRNSPTGTDAQAKRNRTNRSFRKADVKDEDKSIAAPCVRSVYGMSFRFPFITANSLDICTYIDWLAADSKPGGRHRRGKSTNHTRCGRNDRLPLKLSSIKVTNVQRYKLSTR